VSGLLYTFGCLVLPALVAKSLHREVAPMLITAPIIGLAAAIFGFAAAHRYEYPLPQMAVALLSVLLVVSWGVAFARCLVSRR